MGSAWLHNHVLFTESCVSSSAFVNLLQVVILFLPWFPSIFRYFSHRKPVLLKHTSESGVPPSFLTTVHFTEQPSAQSNACVEQFRATVLSLALLVHFHSVLFLWFTLGEIGWLWLSELISQPFKSSCPIVWPVFLKHDLKLEYLSAEDIIGCLLKSPSLVSAELNPCFSYATGHSIFPPFWMRGIPFKWYSSINFRNWEQRLLILVASCR